MPYTLTSRIPANLQTIDVKVMPECNTLDAYANDVQVGNARYDGIIKSIPANPKDVLKIEGVLSKIDDLCTGSSFRYIAILSDFVKYDNKVTKNPDLTIKITTQVTTLSGDSIIEIARRIYFFINYIDATVKSSAALLADTDLKTILPKLYLIAHHTNDLIETYEYLGCKVLYPPK